MSKRSISPLKWLNSEKLWLRMIVPSDLRRQQAAAGILVQDH
jgi:hypothetical protein